MIDSNPHNQPVTPLEEGNIQAIARLEQQSLKQRSSSERVSDLIVRFIGSMKFVVLHLAFFIIWFAVNTGLVPGIQPFDPFPFGIMTLIVSAEGVFLAIFILISQNRMTRLADQRAHLNLQISLLSEKEATKMLLLLQEVHQHLGLGEIQDEETKQLVQDTDLGELAQEIREKVPSVVDS
jgi:uncharacterized membrane protein